MSEVNNDAIKLEFDYAWKHFDFHARQRITMFNFFLVVMAILANAIARIGEGAPAHLEPALLAGGAILSFAFLILDVRNEDLLSKSERVLQALERECFFDRFRSKSTNEFMNLTGAKEKFPGFDGLLMKDERVRTGSWSDGCSFISHRWMIRLIEAGTGVALIVAFVLDFV